MNTLKLDDFNIHDTLLGGQAFNWDLIDDFYYGFFIDKVVKLQYKDGILYWQTYPKKNNVNFIKHYLYLDIDYKNILKKIAKDKWIKQAIKQFYGLRLLRQDFFQTFVSFLLSSNNNISNIRNSIRMLCKLNNKKIQIDKKNFYLFPTVEDFVHMPISFLYKSKCGFRSHYIKLATKKIYNNDMIHNILKADENNTRSILKSFKGIGDKITDCIMVFSLGYYDITPLDVWAKKVFINLYKLNNNMKYDDIRNWIKKYFNNYGAFAGQFLYEWARAYKNILKQ